MNYFEHFKHAARLFWRTKQLWPLGILAAFFGQGEYGFSPDFSQSFSASDPEALPPFFSDLTEQPWIAAFIENPWPYVIGLLLILLLWGIVAALIGWWAQGAMIHMADQADQEHPTSIRASLSAAGARILPLFLINLLLILPVLLLIGLLATIIIALAISAATSNEPDPMMLVTTLLGALACLLPLIVIAGLLGIVLNLVNLFAARACVLEHTGVMDSLRMGWRMIRGNIGWTLLNWFILLVLSGAFSGIAAIPALFFTLPAGFAIINNDWSGWTMAAIVGLTLYSLVVGIGLGGILSAFNSTVWTVLYRVFQRKAAPMHAPTPSITLQ